MSSTGLKIIYFGNNNLGKHHKKRNKIVGKRRKEVRTDKETKYKVEWLGLCLIGWLLGLGRVPKTIRNVRANLHPDRYIQQRNSNLKISILPWHEGLITVTSKYI